MDPQVSVQAEECPKPKETMSRMNESEGLSERMGDVNAQPYDTAEAVARRRTIDVARRHSHAEVATGELQLLAEGLEAGAGEAEIPDRRLALMFVCAHPAIEAGIRAPLMLQLVLGLDAKAIASAFLMSAAAMGKRLVRAKDK